MTNTAARFPDQILKFALTKQRFCILKKKKLQPLGFVELTAVRYSDFGPLSLLPNTPTNPPPGVEKKLVLSHTKPTKSAHAALQSPHCTRTLKANACKATRCKHTSICTRIKNIQCSSVPRKKQRPGIHTVSFFDFWHRYGTRQGLTWLPNLTRRTFQLFLLFHFREKSPTGT